MFLKRCLVMVVGVLLFIGVLLLRFHLADANLENSFKQERVKYGVEDTVLTLPVAIPPLPPAPPVVTPVSTAAAATPDTSSSTSDTTPPPGSTTDTNVLIGPLPPSSTPAPDQMTAPAPLPEVVPAPDTNGGPMMPPSSTSLSLPSHGRVALILLRLAQFQVTQTSNQNSTPAPAAHASAPSASSSATASPAPAPNEASSSHVPASGTGRAIILGYHQFTGPGVPSKNPYSMSQDVFSYEMKYLHDNGYNVVPLSEVVRFAKHQTTLPPNAVAITIDDGYKSSLVWAAPVLKQYNYPWTFFVYPAFITKTESKGAASWPDLIELDKEGIDVECHSMTHPQMTKHFQKFNSAKPRPLSPEEYDQFLTDETSGAKALLEQKLGKKIPYFAYPYGLYNSVVEQKTIAAGFEAIFTVAGNPIHVTTDVHSMGRYIITKPDEPHFTSFLHQGALSLAEVAPAAGAITNDPRPVITAVLGFSGNPASIETDVNKMAVRHDFDPQTSTIRLYLPSDLIKPDVLVSIRAKDTQSGQTMVANWHFQYEPAGGNLQPEHPPISTMPTTSPAPASAAPQPSAPPAAPAHPDNSPASSSTNASPAARTSP